MSLAGYHIEWNITIITGRKNVNIDVRKLASVFANIKMPIVFIPGSNVKAHLITLES